jgi:hypothetical protein
MRVCSRFSEINAVIEFDLFDGDNCDCSYRVDHLTSLGCVQIGNMIELHAVVDLSRKSTCIPHALLTWFSDCEDANVMA